MKRYLGSILMILIALFLVVGCSPKESTETKVLEKITLENAQNLEVEQNEKFSYKSIGVRAHYSDKTMKDVTDKAAFTPAVLDTKTIGKKTVKVSYEKKTASFTVNVIAKKVEKEDVLSLDTSSVQMAFTEGDLFTYNGLKVLLNGEEVETIYLVELFDQNKQEVDPHKALTAGTFEVVVYYEELSQSYTITVSAKQGNEDPKPVQQDRYTAIEVDTTDAQLTYKVNEHLSLTGLKIKGVLANQTKEDIDISQVEYNYYIGTTHVVDFSLAGTYRIEVVYHDAISTHRTEFSVTVGDESTTTHSISFVTAFGMAPQKINGLTTIPAEESLPVLESSEVKQFLGWVVQGTNQAPSYGSKLTVDLVLEAVWEDVETLSILPNVSILSSSSCQVDFDLNAEKVSQISVSLYDDTTVVHTLSSLSEVVNSLDSSKEYTLRGTIEYDHKVYDIVEKTIQTGVYQALELINEEEATTNVCGNSFEIALDQFLEYQPAGYQLAGFLVTKEDGTVVKDIPYAADMDTLYVTGLENDTRYKVQSYYDLMINTFSMTREYPFTSTNGGPYTYRFYYVGFFVLTHGETKYRVRMMYEGNVLYRYYVGEHGFIPNPYGFSLPIELEDYTIAGSMTSLYDITKDMDVDVILVPMKQEDGTHTVIFYGFHEVILSVENVSTGGSATPPTAPQTIQEESNTFTFAYWEGKYTGVTYNTQVYAKYVGQTPSQEYHPHIYPSKIFVGATYVFIDYSIGYYDYVSSITASIQTLDGQTVVDLSNRDQNDLYIGPNVLTPMTSYRYVCEIGFDLGDGNGFQTEQSSVEFTTISDIDDYEATICFEPSQERNLATHMAVKKNQMPFADFGLIVSKTESNEFRIVKYADNTSDYDADICYEYYVRGSKQAYYFAYEDDQNENIIYVRPTLYEFEIPTYGTPEITGIEFVENGDFYDEEHSVTIYIEGNNLNNLVSLDFHLEGIQYPELGEIIAWQIHDMPFFDFIDSKGRLVYKYYAYGEEDPETKQWHSYAFNLGFPRFVFRYYLDGKNIHENWMSEPISDEKGHYIGWNVVKED